MQSNAAAVKAAKSATQKPTLRKMGNRQPEPAPNNEDVQMQDIGAENDTIRDAKLEAITVCPKCNGDPKATVLPLSANPLSSCASIGAVRPTTTTKSSAHSAKPTEEKKAADVVMRPSPKEHARIQSLEKENQTLKNQVAELTNHLSSAKADSKPELVVKHQEEIQQLQTQISSLEKINSEWDTQCNLIDQQRQQALRNLSNAEREKGQLFGELDKRDKSLAHWQGRYETERDKRERDLAAQKKEVLQLQGKLDYHSLLSQKTSAENEKLKKYIEQQEVSVTKAQEAVMHVVSESLSASLPDDRIRKRFSELFDSVAEWARENAKQDRSILENSKKLAEWEKNELLRMVCSPEDSPNLNFNLQDDTAVDTLLNACLTRYMCQDFLKNPFFFAEAAAPITNVNLPEKERLTTDVALKRILNRLLKQYEGKEAEVHAWRAATVKILSNLPHASEGIQRWYGTYLKNTLLPDCNDFIREDLAEQDKEDLLRIVEAFGDFAIRLWSQKYNIRYYCLNFFEDKVYKHDDPCMEIARAVGVEEGDTSLDGRPIPVLVQPYIIGAGTLDGKDYDKGRIWSKGIVWVSKDGRPMPIAAAASRGALHGLVRSGVQIFYSN